MSAPQHCRADGLPLDALQDDGVHAAAAVLDWVGADHMPSYRRGWWWGAAFGAITGAVLVSAFFCAGLAVG